jgi:hypothetical protein
MQNNKAMEIIDILKAYYPRWSADDMEIDNWVKRLVHYDYHRSKAIIENMFFETTSRHIEPSPGKIFEALRTKALVSKVVKVEPICLFVLFKEDIEAQKGFYISSSHIPEQPIIEQQAERMREKFNELYGGNWIIQYAKIPPEPPEDNGLRGAAARDKAFENILNGPDSPSKHWLQKYLKNKHRKETGLKGFVLEDEMPHFREMVAEIWKNLYELLSISDRKAIERYKTLPLGRKFTITEALRIEGMYGQIREKEPAAIGNIISDSIPF